MRKVMVVDDEKFIRLGLKSMLEKSTDVIYEVTLCRDGLEAYETLLKENFDIVITDIRMPEMTGLEFLEKIKDFPNKPEVILLSGYDDFNYAVQALRNGAREYLLKPINRAALSKTLSAIEKELEKKILNKNKEKILDTYEVELSMNKLKYILLKDSINEDELINSINKINLEVLQEDFYVGVITSYATGNMESEDGVVIQSNIKDFIENEIMFLGPQNEYIIISNKKEFFKNLEKTLIRECLYQFTIGVSELCNEVRNIREAYRQGAKAAKYKIIFNDRILIQFNDIQEKNNDYRVPLDEINKLYNVIGTAREKEVDKLLSTILNSTEINRNDISYLDDINQNINDLIFEDLKKKFFPTHNVIYKRSEKFSNIFNFYSINEYCFELKQYLLEISNHMKNINDGSVDSGNINKALKYIKENYNKDITMATVSNEVSLNYSYFSHIFKEHTGDTFLNYLRKIRLEKAQELLKTCDLKVYEVAREVGYEDAKQFAKVFRKYVGISPIEYKEKHSKEL